MTPGTVRITTFDSDYPEGDFTAARIWFRSDARAKTNITWLQNAMNKFPGPDPYALASQIMLTGGDIWLTISPIQFDSEQYGPEWLISRDSGDEKWILDPPKDLK